MKKTYLLPHHYKNIGWVLFLPALFISVLRLVGILPECNVSIPVLYNSGFIFSSKPKGFFVSADVDLVSNCFGALLMIGGLLVGFSQEKIEDEYIASMRLKALLRSFLVYYLLMFILFISVFGIDFLWILFVAFYLPLVSYILYFHYLLWRNEK